MMQGPHIILTCFIFLLFCRSSRSNEAAAAAAASSLLPLKMTLDARRHSPSFVENLTGTRGGQTMAATVTAAALNPIKGFFSAVNEARHHLAAAAVVSWGSYRIVRD